MTDPRAWEPPEEDDDLPQRRPLILKLVAVVVSIGLVMYIADLFFALVLR